jgi:2-methylisocitrate lyase-like PEP mutase family enzyme
MNRQNIAIDEFRTLHKAGCFVVPNPWDKGSAVYLESLGFKALATTSAGFAFSRGLPDGSAFVPLDMALEHVREIAEVTSLPVSADFQNGYAAEAEQVATNVSRCLATGVAGLSIEDSTGSPNPPLYDFKLAVERIGAAREAINRAASTGVILTARCEAWLVGDPDPLRTSRDRLVAYAGAGADCLYAPGVSKPDEIAAIVKAVAPKPVNVLISTHNCTLTVSQLADLGVRRISVGGALARVAWGAFMASAKAIQERGSFQAFAQAAPHGELDKIFRDR